ncbi:RNA polymerase sigma factor [Acidipila rosea]|uniref:RNA polymerase sigma-70 factor (ECF subfamily) n=1 Tax=Acidipila rosea TaxID=768535 RepID=A0A4R1L5U5_9BACT|nr:sigma-70 family RNA polymerase sigma factor [Acidipila rosea]MBW4026623.1 sigma-70 family RNA polymerase sigma factor [Acidobacteriota bacterium]MBW4044799.1 sigma-70 family RNA polymerase sigma factor [Acidobacteriota bacterium]TCK73505.1 RNA polymerase sigma-70 factor (ECF subfamily) [Acidipila rosea]
MSCTASYAGGGAVSPAVSMEEFTEVFCRHRSQLRWVAMKILKNVDETDDALQDAALAAVKNIEHFEGRSKLLTWLTQIVRNEALMRIRRHQRVQLNAYEEADGEEGHGWQPHLADTRPNPEEMYGRREAFELVERRLSLIPAEMRRAICLHHLEGRTMAEVSAELNTSLATVKNLLHRGRAQLQEPAQGLGGSSRGTGKLPLSA